MLKAHSNTMLDLVIFLTIDEAVIKERLKSRSQVSQRADDQDIEKIMQRIALYNEHTRPIVDYYTKQHKIVHIVGTQSIPQVTQAIRQAMTTCASSSDKRCPHPTSSTK